MEEFNHIMLDLETMGNTSNSVIVSIAAVPFNLESNEVSAHCFYELVDFQSCLDVGLTVNASTVLWWMQQNDDARKELYKPKNPAESIHKALNDLYSFFREFNKDVQVWGNGARFDLGLLEDAYRACNYHEMPWDFRKERDVRTLVSLAPQIKETTPFKGTEHHPIDDCIHQINYCCAIYNHLTKKSEPEYQYKLETTHPLISSACDICGCHPNVIITTHKGTFCMEHAKY